MVGAYIEVPHAPEQGECQRQVYSLSLPLVAYFYQLGLAS